jgi:hypothetical protein
MLTILKPNKKETTLLSRPRPTKKPAFVYGLQVMNDQINFMHATFL